MRYIDIYMCVYMIMCVKIYIYIYICIYIYIYVTCINVVCRIPLFGSPIRGTVNPNIIQ